jgi:hypothetical protein
MKKFLTKLLFKWCYQEIMSELVRDFYGEIPTSLKEPSMMFFSQNRRNLERFFSIQAYKVTRRSIGETKNAQFYDGMLAHIKSILVAVSSAPLPVVKEDMPKDKEVAVLDSILSFRDSRKKKEESS